MKKYKNHTLEEYSKVLSERTSVPGGGSAAAYCGALGVSLLMMVARFSLGKNKPKRVEDKINKVIAELQEIEKKLLFLVDEDAAAFLNVMKSRNSDSAAKKQAQKKACAVPKEVCRLSYKAVGYAQYLVQHGNPYLLSDVKAALELLLAAHSSAKIFTQ